MKLFNTIKISLSGVLTNRSRSLLTILGIVIGITAVILVMSVGQGAEALILNEVRGLGTKTIIVEPGKEPSGPSDFIEVFTDTLRRRDLESLRQKAKVPDLVEAEPVVFQVVSVSYGSEARRATLRGGTDLMARILNLYPREGELYSAEQIKSKASVAVIGAEVKDDLFGLNVAIGKKIKIKNKQFTVIGVLPNKGQSAFFDVDNAVLIPYTTAQEYILGIDYFNAIVVEAASEDKVEQVKRDITLTLRENHGITDPDKDDFHVTTQADIVQRIGVISTVLSVLLSSIAAISLVVGGVGIMNIMLVVVTERTREIGLRKAVGARNSDILSQFLLEAVILTLSGGLAGIIGGTLLSLAASLILSRVVNLAWQFTFPFFAALLGLSVAAAVGLIFGLYPAYIASRKSPIEALRWE